ncbi:MAG: PKD domain-containing protein [Bacteroidota bacterium]
MTIFRFFPSFLLFCCFGFSTALLGQTATETVGCAPFSVSFTAPDDATTFFWDFKDGATSTEQNPTNTFVRSGTYEVDFSAEQGGAVIGTITVNIFETPTVEIVQDPEVGCAPATITLTNTTDIPEGITLQSTTWTFPDGSGQVGLTAQKEYPLAGDFDVTVAIRTNSANCNSSRDFTDFIKIESAPETAFSISPDATACEGPFEVTFGNDTPGSDLTYLWDLGNGNLSSEENPPNQTYTEGTYEISLTTTNPQGCSKTVTQKVSVGAPDASFSVPDTVCVGTEVTLQNQASAGTYNWTISGPANLVSAEASPTFDFPVGGNYTITLLVTAEGGTCTQDSTITIFAQDVSAEFAAVPTYDCVEPMSVTFTPNSPIEGAMYEWNFGDDSTSVEVSPTHDYNADNESPFHENGEFVFNPMLTVTTSAGCKDESSAEVILDIPLARFMPDTVSGCAPLTVEFSDSSQSTTTIQSWEWIYGDGETANFDNNNPHSYTFDEAGEYDVQLVITNELDCPDTSFVIRVEVGTPITPNFGVDKTSVCEGEEIQFTDLTNNPNIDEWHYYTDNGRSSHCFDEANPVIAYESETGQFDVQLVVGYNGCLDSLTQTDFIEVKGPIADIAYMTSCDTPNTVMFTSISGDASNVTWDFGDMNTSTQAVVSHDYETTRDYMVKLTAENLTSNCPATVDSVMIFIRNIKADGPVEMLQCKDQPVMLDSSPSEDVDTSCFRGYTWFFNHPSVRPVTTSGTTVDDISYPDTGRYTIDLVVEDVNGCTDTARYPIIVHEATVSFEVDKSEICVPSTVNFTNLMATTTSQSIESVMWDFGDGGMSEEPNLSSYTYSTEIEADRVVVSLNIEDDAGCPASDQKTIEVYTPTSQIISSDLTICAGESVDLRATDFVRGDVVRPLSYEWNLGNGQSANTQTASATFDEGGIYTISLDYEEIATGCGSSTTVTAEVQDFPTAAFTSDVDGQAELCAPALVNFTDASTSLVPLAQSWDFGNGGAGVGPTVQASFNPGTYTVRLAVQTSNGCDDEATREFTFDEGPTANIDLSAQQFCIGDMVTATIVDTSNVRGFSWEFEGTTFGENEMTVTFPVTRVPQGGQAPLKLNLNGIGECNTAEFVDVPVNVVAASFGVTKSACDLDVTFTNSTFATGNISSSWNFGDGTTSTQTSPSHTFAEEGTYDVTLMVTDLATGCMGEISQTVSVGRIATNAGFNVLVGQCLDVQAAIDPIFLAQFQNFIIDYGDGSAPTTDISYLYREEGNYTVTLVGETDENCPSDILTRNVTVQKANTTSEVKSVFVPNAFSPGMDGVNDIFRVSRFPLNPDADVCRRVNRVLSYKIFHRTGKEVYSNTQVFEFPPNFDPTEENDQPGWNGAEDTGGGGSYPSGVYLYAIEVEYDDGTSEVLKGDVTLIR